jgi:hypothetical protein
LIRENSLSDGPISAVSVQGLRENGFVEGDNIIIERRFTAGRNNRAPEMVAELLQRADLPRMSGTKHN